MLDTYGRRMEYLRVSVTPRCNLRCRYCVPSGAFAAEADPLPLETLFRIVREFVSLGIRKIRVTGGEPLLRPGVVPFIREIAALPGVTETSLTTNGILLPGKAQELKAAGLCRVNVSLDTLRADRYRRITGGGSIEAVFAAIRAAKETGLSPVKVNVVLIAGFNDDEIGDFITFSDREEVEVRFIELMPIGEGIAWAAQRSIPVSEVLRRCPDLAPLPAEEPAATARRYCLPGRRAVIGLISPVSCNFCAACDRLRLSAQGRLRLCLHSKAEYGLADAAGDPEALRQRILDAVACKPRRHHLAERQFVLANMSAIGG